MAGNAVQHVLDHYNIIEKVYQTGRKVAADFRENMRIVFDDLLPQWNYRAIPLSIANG